MTGDKPAFFKNETELTKVFICSSSRRIGTTNFHDSNFTFSAVAIVVQPVLYFFRTSYRGQNHTQIIPEGFFISFRILSLYAVMPLAANKNWHRKLSYGCVVFCSTQKWTSPAVEARLSALRLPCKIFFQTISGVEQTFLAAL